MLTSFRSINRLLAGQTSRCCFAIYQIFAQQLSGWSFYWPYSTGPVCPRRDCCLHRASHLKFRVLRLINISLLGLNEVWRGIQTVGMDGRFQSIYYTNVSVLKTIFPFINKLLCRRCNFIQIGTRSMETIFGSSV